MWINAHTHMYSGLAPLGMPAPEVPPENFVQILERVWWKLDRALDHESIRASAELYVAEALRFKTSGLIDHHESPNCIEGSLDVLADVCQGLGMPAVLTYGATERNGGIKEANDGLEECRRFIEENRRPVCRGMVGLHAAFTVSDDTIYEASELARALRVGLHIHVAEDRADVDDAVERGYTGVIDRLKRNGALIPGSIFAHGVHLTRDEVTQCAEAGIWLVQNPRSNWGNRVGYPANLAASGKVALGTDGYPSNMEEETETLMAEAERNGDDVLAASKRSTAGRELFDYIFSNPLGPAAPPLGAKQMETVRARAETQAALLWERMKAI